MRYHRISKISPIFFLTGEKSIIMWEVVRHSTNTHYPAYMDTMAVITFVHDLGFSSMFQALRQCKVDIDRMKCYVHGKRVKTVKELDELLRYYEYTFDDSVILYQLCTQNSLAYVCEKSQNLIPAGVHMGSGNRSHVIKITNRKVFIGKTFRCFEIDDAGSVDTHLLKINIEVDLKTQQVTMLFHLKPRVD